MKKIIFSHCKGKIISPAPIESSDFMDRICRSMEADSISTDTSGHARLHVRGKILPLGYHVDIDIMYRRVRYSFDSDNMTMALVVAAFAGLLVFKGGLDTYIFWAIVISAIFYWLNNTLTHSRISSAIRSILPDKPHTESRALPINTSITYQKRCPACGCVVSAFGSVCPDCGISIRAPQESCGSLSGYRLRYFFKKNKDFS